MATTDDLLDLLVSLRTSTFRYKVLDQALGQIGLVHPDAKRPPTIETNINRIIKRDMRSFRLSTIEEPQVNPVADRIAPEMILENGAVFPLGVFLYVDASRLRRHYASAPGGPPEYEFSASLLDQSFILDQEIDRTIGYSAGTSIYAALVQNFDDAGVPYYLIDGITATIKAPIAWPAGTSRLEIMNALCAMAGCYSVYFDNSGLGRVRIRADLATTPPTVRYRFDALGGNIYKDTVIETDNLLSAPNRWVVVDSSSRSEGTISAPIRGQYDIPDSAPHSIANRGFAIPKVIDVQGIESTAAANDMARAAAQQDGSDFRWVSFTGAPDPRHDTFDIIEYDGAKYREQGHKFTCREGAGHTHDLRQVYEEEAA